MALSKDVTANVIKNFSRMRTDTGSSEVQIALLTERIKTLTGHFKTHKKDFHSQRGLLNLISQRRKLLDYIKKSEPKIYQKTIQELSLRK